MACCGGCSCYLAEGDNVSVTGSGSSAHPWVINAVIPEPEPDLEDDLPTSGVGTYPAIAQTHSRRFISGGHNRTSGVMYASLVHLKEGMIARAMTMCSGGAAMETTLRRFALYDAAFNLVASSANDSNPNWGTGDLKTLSFTTPYTAPADGAYFAAVLEVGSVVPQVYAAALSSTAALTSLPPAIAWTQSALANLPATAVPVYTGTQRALWAAVSGTA